MQDGDEHPCPDRREHADQQGGREPEDRAGLRVGDRLSTTIATMNPTKAAVSIIPSIPMLTMPLRSFSTPHIAPSARWASASVCGARFVVRIASMR